jgi:hypothetical protein
MRRKHGRNLRRVRNQSIRKASRRRGRRNHASRILDHVQELRRFHEQTPGDLLSILWVKSFIKSDPILYSTSRYDVVGIFERDF